MSVKLHVDLETLQLIQGPGLRSAVNSLRFKRGDAARIQVIFLESGISPVPIGDPDALEIQIGIKPRNQFDHSYLAHSAVWSMPAEGDDTPTYECELSLNTLQLNSALNVGSATAEELPEITLMGEITWREGNGEPTSTRTFLVVVENDVNRGTEGAPTDANPGNITLTGTIAASNLSGTNTGDNSPNSSSATAAQGDLADSSLQPVAVDYRGEYNNGDATYGIGSVVLFSGVLYEKISNPNNAGYPPTGTDWELFEPLIGSPAYDLWVQTSLAGSGNALPLAGGTMDNNASIIWDNASAIREAGEQGLEIECSVGYRWQWVAGRMILRQINSGQISRILAIDDITPGATHDITEGFVPGTRWETVDGTVYVCTDSTEDAAVWEPILITAADISDSTAAGRTLLTAADAAAQIAALGAATPESVEAQVEESYQVFDSPPDSTYQTTAALTVVEGMFPTAFRAAIIGMTGISVEFELNGDGNGSFYQSSGDLEISLSLSVGAQVSLTASYYDWSSDSYFSGWWYADQAPDPLSSASVVFDAGSWDSTESIESLADAVFADAVTIALYPSVAGKFAIYQDGIDYGIAYCSEGGGAPVWHLVDSAWIAARLAAGALTMGQVSGLQDALDAKINEGALAISQVTGLQDELDGKQTSLDAFPSPLVLRSSDSSRWRINISTDGVLSSAFLTDALVTSYFEATGIESAAAEELQEFVTALSAAGVLGNLIDGGILKSRHARIASGQIRSLRGISNLVLTGSPTLGNCGLIFNGTNQAARAVLTTNPLQRSFFCLSTMRQNFQTPFTNIAIPWIVKNNYPFNSFSGEYVRFEPSQNNATIGSMADGGTTGRNVSSPDGFSRAFPPRSFFSRYTYDGTLANYTANGMTFGNYGGTKRFGSTSKNGAIAVTGNPHAPYYVSLGAGYTTTAHADFCASSAANWMLFNKVLSDGEVADIYAAFFLLHPRWKYVPGGDSLMQFQTPYFLTLPEIYGTNVNVTNIAAGGLPVPTIVAGLGTTYYSAAHLAADGPVVADFINIDTITGAYTKEQYRTDLRAIWTHIKTINPTAKIIGQTITSSDGFETEGTLAQLDTLNGWIRADIGTYYDVLVDTWQIAQDMKNPAIDYQHNDSSVIVDGVHPSAALCNAIGAAKIAAIESLNIRIR